MSNTMTVVPETGELVATFNFDKYVADLGSKDATARQKQLAAAYDAACRALIGPNDVQKEGGREFKKKSAWRKLQRHFNISTRVVRKDNETIGDHFVATVIVRASAPWGQEAEAIGACGKDEEIGRRKITLADAIATAETRATNRAVSNLIAMGEVSAEEIGDRSETPEKPEKIVPCFEIPFGNDQGKQLNELSAAHLERLRDWCVEKETFPDLVMGIDLEIQRRERESESGRL